MTEEELDRLEEQIPDLAIKAWKEAYAAAMKKFGRVAEDDGLYWNYQDGRREFIQKLGLSYSGNTSDSKPENGGSIPS